ncbi:MAG: hypothetical protein GEU90_01700 [Gemmatimonas sp.]|nr:hypothetical protein [Gemmatimonas sp.]
MTEASPDHAVDVAIVKEVLDVGDLPLWRHPDWVTRFPWLAQGTTGRGTDTEPFDLGSFGDVPAGTLMNRWHRLLRGTGQQTAVHSRQVHGVEVAEWVEPIPPGLLYVSGYDAHLTNRLGVLLSVSIADCVPVFLVAEQSRALALAHAGWRGAAGSIVEKVIGGLSRMSGEAPETFWLHCGPAICGVCYEVGPEVHAGVHPFREVPSAPKPIDLRAAIASRAIAAGLLSERISVSGLCTLCGPSDFFSHRGGSAGRQMGVLGRLA